MRSNNIARSCGYSDLLEWCNPPPMRSGPPGLLAFISNTHLRAIGTWMRIAFVGTRSSTNWATVLLIECFAIDYANDVIVDNLMQSITNVIVTHLVDTGPTIYPEYEFNMIYIAPPSLSWPIHMNHTNTVETFAIRWRGQVLRYQKYIVQVLQLSWRTKDHHLNWDRQPGVDRISDPLTPCFLSVITILCLVSDHQSNLLI